MNYFFGFDSKLAENADWMFNINHLFLFGFLILILTGLYFGLYAKTAKGQRITKLVLAAVMLVFEIGRIIYKAAEHLHTNGSMEGFAWAWSISFQMCAIMCWTTIGTLIASCFVKPDNRVLVIFKNILFGAGLLGGALTFVYPDFLSAGRPILHFVNIQTILIHALLIFAPVYLVKIKELEIRLKNIWMPVLGFMGVAAISAATSHIFGNNFAFALGNPLFSEIGLNLPLPWHLPLTFLIIFTVPVIYYGVFELIYRKKNKRAGDAGTPRKKHSAMEFLFIILPYAAGVLCAFLIFFIPVWLGAQTGTDIGFDGRAVNSLSGLVALIPFIAYIAFLIIFDRFKIKFFNRYSV